MLRRVSRGVPDVEVHVADGDAVTFVHHVHAFTGPAFAPAAFTRRARPTRRFRRETVAPLRAPFTGHIHGRARACCEFAHTGHEVGVDVRFGDGDDTQPFARGERDVGRDVAERIDHDGFADGLTADHVTRLREVAVVQLPEEHGGVYPEGRERGQSMPAP